MEAPGSGAAPNIFNLSSTCSTAGSSVVSFSCNKVITGSICEVFLVQDSTGTVYGTATLTSTQNVKAITFTGAPNGSYTLTADNGENSTSRQVTVFCSGTPPPAGNVCTIALTNVAGVAPTTAAGFGAATFTVAGVQTALAVIRLYNAAGPAGGPALQSTNVFNPGSAAAFGGLLPGTYKLVASESEGAAGAAPCETVETEVVIPAPAPTGTAPAPAPAVFYPVGGVLANPVLLACTVSSLTTATGGPRVGLHLEVELYRSAAAEGTIATARKTVRGLQELVDVATYLRPLLQAQQNYPPNSGLLRDAATAFAFAYRFREVDSTGAGVWQDRPNPAFAVLAARPPERTTLQDMVARVGSLARFASVFPTGEAVQFVGYPLEVGIMLPEREATLPTFLEAVYYDGAGAPIEIRSWPVLASAAAGYYRLCLPEDALPCAAKLLLSVCNENRAFTGSCLGVAIPPVLAEGGRIIAGTGYLLRK